MSSAAHQIGDVPDTKPAAKHNPLEQFVLLAKSTKGAACTDLIRHALEAPGVYVFGELLEMPNIKELENGTHKPHWNTLNLFAYGTYKQYLDNKNDLIVLTDVMKRKLQYLTIVTMATLNKCIPYKDLLAQLDIDNVRNLEDLIIESIYSDIIHGKLDQRNRQLEVDYTIGRDIRSEDISKIAETLQEWCESCETVLATIEEQIEHANANKTSWVKHQDDIDSEILNLKKTLKTQLLEVDEAMTMDHKEPNISTPACSQETRKKTSKSKVGKVSSGTKSWFKNFS